MVGYTWRTDEVSDVGYRFEVLPLDAIVANRRLGLSFLRRGNHGINLHLPLLLGTGASQAVGIYICVFCAKNVVFRKVFCFYYVLFVYLPLLLVKKSWCGMLMEICEAYSVYTRYVYIYVFIISH